MAEIRFNYGDKFTQTSDSNTGIGSTIPAGKLDVAGNTSAASLRVSGIATLSSYQGFVNTKLSTTEDIIVEAGQSGSVSGEVVIGTGQTISVSTGATTGQGGIQSLKVYETFMPPVGGTADRPTDVKPGMVYYNKDFKTIEFWDGNFWKQVDNTTASGRAVIMGGAAGPSPSIGNQIQFFQIMTLGNCEDFGDLIEEHQYAAGSGSNTRGIIAGGYSAPDSGYSQPRIEYLTMASKGDGITFGELSASHFRNSGGASSSTRGMFFGGGHPSYYNTIEYVEINTLGNALDFGDLLSQKAILGCTSSPTRAFARGGYHPSNDSKISSQIDMVTIASKGNATKFGDPTQRTYGLAACANNIRAIYAGGYSNHPDSGVISQSKTIEYFTMASEGNAIDFGDLIIGKDSPCGNSNQVRGVISGGYVSPTGTNSMEFITITTTGAAQDFGDLTNTDFRMAGTSDSHGGLGGF